MLIPSRQPLLLLLSKTGTEKDPLQKAEEALQGAEKIIKDAADMNADGKWKLVTIDEVEVPAFKTAAGDITSQDSLKEFFLGEYKAKKEALDALKAAQAAQAALDALQAKTAKVKKVTGNLEEQKLAEAHTPFVVTSVDKDPINAAFDKALASKTAMNVKVGAAIVVANTATKHRSRQECRMESKIWRSRGLPRFSCSTRFRTTSTSPNVGSEKHLKIIRDLNFISAWCA